MYLCVFDCYAVCAMDSSSRADLGRLLKGAASWHRTYEDAGTFLGFAFTKSGIRCRAASDAGLHPKNAGILICAMQRSSDAGAASRHHPAYINHEYQQKNWKIKKKSWKICKKKVENAFLRFSKCKSCIRCIFCIGCQNAAPLVNALSSRSSNSERDGGGEREKYHQI